MTISGRFVNLGPFAVVQITCSSFVVTATGHRIFIVVIIGVFRRKVKNNGIVYSIELCLLSDTGNLMDSTSQVTFVLGPLPYHAACEVDLSFDDGNTFLPSNTTLHVRGPATANQCHGLTCLNCTVAYSSSCSWYRPSSPPLYTSVCTSLTNSRVEFQAGIGMCIGRFSPVSDPLATAPSSNCASFGITLDTQADPIVSLIKADNATFVTVSVTLPVAVCILILLAWNVLLHPLSLFLVTIIIYVVSQTKQ